MEGREAGECVGETCACVCVRGGGRKERRRARASARAAEEGGEEEGWIQETGCVRAEGPWPGRDTLGACRAPPSICPVQTPPNNAEHFRVWLVGGGSPPDPPLHCPRPQGHLCARHDPASPSTGVQPSSAFIKRRRLAAPSLAPPGA